jgi:2-keto-4-pentenoate hydratase/2-oxohepta-3-ene-1,7-dioic acid hydratase in catechol pathway
MRWCRFEHKNASSFGIIEDDKIIPVAGSPFGSYERLKTRVSLARAKLLAPVDKPIFYATSRNYRKNLQDSIGRSNRIFAMAEPWAGYRAASAITGPDADVVIPSDCPDDVYFQGEIVVVIGKKARHLTHDGARDAIFGYTIGNDVTCDTWATTDTRSWRGKNVDTWKPLGPWIETELDVDKAMCRVRYNGQELVGWNINQWYFSPADVLVAITRYITVNPGDILMMGTEGVRSPYVKHGDQVEVEVSGLGTLRNRFVKSVDWY